MTAPALDATFEAVLFDWDGTAVTDRQADATAVRERILELSAAGVDLFVVTGTHVSNVDGQLAARPPGPGRLFLCCNRGSEVFEVGPDGPTVVWRREATAAEERALDLAAEAVVAALTACGLTCAVVSQRLNRRKIDLIPEPEWADPPKARIGDLLAAVLDRLGAAGLGGLDDVIERAEAAARAAGLGSPRITSDVKHVEIGLTDKSDSAAWAAGWLAERGVTGGLVLVAGDELGQLGGVRGSDSLMLVPALDRSPVVSVGAEPNGVPARVQHLGGGPPAFLVLLDEQLHRRHLRRVPWIDEDPAWVVRLPADPALARAAEAIGTVGNGWVGVRGAREEDGPGSVPSFLVAGIYDPEGDLLPGPVWTGMEVDGAADDQRLLDLHTGVLVRSSDGRVPFRSLRFVSAARPEAMALRAEGAPDELRAVDPFQVPNQVAELERTTHAASELARVAAGAGGPVIGVAVREAQSAGRTRRIVERVATWVAAQDADLAFDAVAAPLDAVAEAGFDALLAEHRRAWAQRWDDAMVCIEGDPALELAARFAVFHLLASAASEGEAPVGARGLTGPAYGGHVFWDADVFVLPALAATHPRAARAMLEYRVRRLPAALAAAASQGRRGARFPWESATSGDDVTPRVVQGPGGVVIPIQTGQREEHIVASIAWAACTYVDWTADAAFAAGPGRELVVEGARYWASRIQTDEAGRGHLLGVMGPDEYHECVDDDAFTNVMARWQLRRGAELLLEHGGSPTEAAAWREAADALTDGWDAGRSLYEQFAGYWDLEPLLMTNLAPPPVAADVLLGPARVHGSQLIKQADVLMLHHLLPDEVPPGSLGPNLAFYDPRTAHGSSLSPAIHASLWARAGHPGRALELLRLAARLDLDDLTGTTAGGLHLATMGGLWQALAQGFLGLRPTATALEVDPCLPRTWDALSLRCRFHGQPVEVRADQAAVTVRCRAPLMVRVAGGVPQVCEPPGADLPYPRRQP